MSELTGAEVLGTVADRLTRAGFEIGPELGLSGGEQLRLFEDDVSVVGVVQYRSWAILRDNWLEAQSAVVELLTDRLERSDPKAWEGYLVLITLDRPVVAEADEIRRDTARLRKLVATGNDLARVSQVEDALLPVLPLTGGVLRHASGSILDRLPALLFARSIDLDLTSRVVRAHKSDRPLMEAVSEWMDAQ